jgi:hypothetical protein
MNNNNTNNQNIRTIHHIEDYQDCDINTIIINRNPNNIDNKVKNGDKDRIKVIYNSINTNSNKY